MPLALWLQPPLLPRPLWLFFSINYPSTSYKHLASLKLAHLLQHLRFLHSWNKALQCGSGDVTLRPDGRLTPGKGAFTQWVCGKAMSQVEEMTLTDLKLSWPSGFIHLLSTEGRLYDLSFKGKLWPLGNSWSSVLLNETRCSQSQVQYLGSSV